MRYHPWSSMEKPMRIRKVSERLLMLLTILLLPVLSLPAFALAEPDSAMQQSLNAFFAHGVVVRGASAELIRVERWPQTSGTVRWSLPTSLHGHPGRLSLIAEQNGRRWYIPVRVHWWAMAIVMKQSVPARTLLTHNMLKKTRTDIAGHHSQWLAQISELTGMRLTRRVNKGDMLLSSFVKRPPLIKRGDMVQILLDIGHLHVRAEGQALRSARRGERILIKNLRSKEVIQAIVEQAGAVRVQLRGVTG